MKNQIKLNGSSNIKTLKGTNLDCFIKSSSTTGVKNSRKELEHLLLNYLNQNHTTTFDTIKHIDTIIYRLQQDLDAKNKIASRVNILENQLFKALDKIDTYKNTSIFKIALDRLARFIGFKLNINLVKLNKRGGL